MNMTIRNKKIRREDHIRDMYSNNIDNVEVTYIINSDVSINSGDGSFSASMIMDSMDTTVDTLGNWKAAYHKFEAAVYEKLSNTDVFDYDVSVELDRDCLDHRHGLNTDCYGDDHRSDWKDKAKNEIVKDLVAIHMLDNS
tara:strand:+ start:41 stop:460 length:420 start_codon:yes stop_codon:yes gene_type:complete